MFSGQGYQVKGMKLVIYTDGLKSVSQIYEDSTKPYTVWHTKAHKYYTSLFADFSVHRSEKSIDSYHIIIVGGSSLCPKLSRCSFARKEPDTWAKVRNEFPTTWQLSDGMSLVRRYDIFQTGKAIAHFYGENGSRRNGLMMRFLPNKQVIFIKLLPSPITASVRSGFKGFSITELTENRKYGWWKPS